MTQEEKTIKEALLRDYHFLKKEETRLKKEIGLIAQKRNQIKRTVERLDSQTRLSFDNSAHAIHLYAINNYQIGESYV